MRIFITGISGFLGSHLAEELKRLGHDVDGVDSGICSSVKVSPLQKVDCCDTKIMKNLIEGHRTSVLIHCAATAHEGASAFAPAFITKNISQASISTYSAAISAGVRRIVNMSSMARYGKQSLPFHESMTPQPVDCYGIAKVASENSLKVLCDLHGVEWVNLIPHNIIGPRQKYNDPFRNVCSIMINRALKGKDLIVYGDGLQKRCFSPIKDCLHSLIRAIDAPVEGHTINIGPDHGEMTILDMAKMIIELTGSKVGITHMPDRPLEVKSAYCTSKKARELLEFKPQQSVRDCIGEMIDYVKEHGTMEFDYFIPLEIINDKIPRTWKERLI